MNSMIASIKAFLIRTSYITKYALLMTLLVFILKWLQWKFLIVDHALEIYVGFIALFFTLLGIWMAAKMIHPRVEKVVVEKNVYIGTDDHHLINEAEIEKLNLSGREYEVLQHLVRGHSNAQIAEEMCLSISTIKTHASNLFNKMDVKSRTQAIEKAQRLRLVAPTLPT
ncbi:MAG: response regulator transcription factor [Saprospiraceae bacterium]|nr:response regulator transcription factor [Saprospiraceae bacterium]